MSEPAARPLCDHHWACHIRGGEPLSVRICTLCGDPDWDDLRGQLDQRAIDATVAEVTVASSAAAIRVTATDVECGDSQTIEIDDTYVLVTAGRCQLTSTTAHANGTHLLTVKNASGGSKRVVQ